MSSAYPPIDQLELLHDELARREAEQGEELDGLARKATTVWAANGVVFGLVFNASDTFRGTGWPTFTAFVVALGLLALGLIAGVAALWPVSRIVVPKPGYLVEKFYSATREETLAQLVVTRAAAFEKNEGLSAKKDLRMKIQMVMLSVSAVVFVVAFALREAHV